MEKDSIEDGGDSSLTQEGLPSPTEEYCTVGDGDSSLTWGGLSSPVEEYRIEGGGARSWAPNLRKRKIDGSSILGAGMSDARGGNGWLGMFTPATYIS